MLALSCYPEEETRFCHFPRKAVCTEGMPRPLGGGMIPWQKKSAAEDLDLYVFPQDISYLTAHLPHLPSSSELSHSKCTEQRVLSDGGSPVYFSLLEAEVYQLRDTSLVSDLLCNNFISQKA